MYVWIHKRHVIYYLLRIFKSNSVLRRSKFLFKSRHFTTTSYVCVYGSLTGSSVKPLTHPPVLRTIIVALPYSAYPPATISLPDWRRSASQAGPSHTCTIIKLTTVGIQSPHNYVFNNGFKLCSTILSSAKVTIELPIWGVNNGRESFNYL